MLIKVRTFLLLCVVFPVFVFGLWLLYGWLPTFLHDKFALNQSDAALQCDRVPPGHDAVGLIGGGVVADMLVSAHQSLAALAHDARASSSARPACTRSATATR